MDKIFRGLNSVIDDDYIRCNIEEPHPRISLLPRRCLERGFHVRGVDVIAELRRRLITEDECKHARTSRAVHALNIGHSIRVIVVTSGASVVRKTREVGGKGGAKYRCMKTRDFWYLFSRWAAGGKNRVMHCCLSQERVLLPCFSRCAFIG